MSGGRVGLLVLLAAAGLTGGCKQHVSSPQSVPVVQVYELAEFADVDQDYGVTIVRSDVDADGQDELLVGSPASDPSGDGIVLFVTTGDYRTVDAVFPWRAVGETSEHHDQYGRSLRVADFDGDGQLDLAVGDPQADVDAVAQAGEVWVYFGPIDASRATRLRATASATGARFGETLATGDFDADGFVDLAVGAPHPAGLVAGVDDATVEVFFGPDLVRRESWTASSPGGQFGASLTTLPPTSVVGGSALVAGAPETSDPTVVGQAFAWFRDDAGTPRRLSPADAAASRFGCATELGDFDGDGVAELAVFAPRGHGGVDFFDADQLARRGRVALPSVLASRNGAPVVRFPDVSRDRADELVLLSSDQSEPAAVLFSPGRALAHLELDFAASCGVVGNFDFDAEDELLLATPTSFKPSGGYGLLRVVDFTWQANRSLAVPTKHVILGSRALRGER
jgi:hypothetical protein